MKKVLATTILVMLALTPAFAATSSANLKGIYNFQTNGISNQYGYYSCPGSTCTWVQVSGSCPTGQSCENQAFPKTSVGTLSFDGKGTTKFVSIVSYNSGGQGPVAGTTCAYAVSGFTGNLTNCVTKGVPISVGTITLSLGGFNPAQIATTVLILVSDGDVNDLNTGIASLQ